MPARAPTTPNVTPVWVTVCLAMAIGSIGCDPADGDDDAPTPDAQMTDVAPDAATPIDMGPGETTLQLRYHRADADYEGLTLQISGDAVADGIEASMVDDFGAVFDVPAAPGDAIAFQITGEGIASPAEPLAVSIGADSEGVWYFEGGEMAYDAPPPAIPGPDQVVIHYLRDDDTYDGWGLHLWEDVVMETAWMAPAIKGGIDPRFGAWWVVDVAPEGERVNVIVHAGDEKDPGPDMGWNISELGDIVFLVTGSAEISPFPRSIPGLAIRGAGAHWIDSNTMVWGLDEEAATFELRADPAGAITIENGQVSGGEVIALETAAMLQAEQAERFPHLGRGQVLVVPGSVDHDAVLSGQLVAIAYDAAGAAVAATGVQIAGVLDDRNAYDGPLGATFEGRTPSLHVWAPTARQVRLVRFDDALDPLGEPVDMVRGPQGTWSVTGEADWYGSFYRYEVTVFHPQSGQVETVQVTDPYSVSLSADSRHSQIVDIMGDAALRPAGWEAMEKPILEAVTDVAIYETHVRDFSVFDDSVDPAHRGGYLAFVDSPEAPTRGMDHLRALSEAGLSILHLLPAFDIATVKERREDRIELSDPVRRLCELGTGAPASLCEEHGDTPIVDLLATYDPTTPDAQALHAWIRPNDGFNWGYDPFHYTVPEGSYATDPHGTARVVEFRRMVQALSDAGLRVALDVVYNHTHASGLGDQSVLDRIVPGYYHRLNIETGNVETSTCCANTASENVMMERLMVDSVVTWARAYKVDAFRFDLMGHHMKRNMLAVQAALSALTIEADGVDGAAIYLYGEGWNFGEVANNARGENAIQENMGGTGIGTFNDRIRDGVRGGGPFDSSVDLIINQGFANGLVVDPNGAEGQDEAEALARLLETKDHIRLSMAGNLKAFRLVTAVGATSAGALLGYNGQRAGYAEGPADAVNYVSKHDNQTLFDNNAYKAPDGTSMDDRVRMQILALSTVALGQGIPFFHAGSELLRSKSMERDSYDSGDWFNRLDWSMQTNNWNVGLPREDKDGGNWPVIQQILADESIAPEPAHIQRAAALFRELLQIRFGSRLFRLTTADAIAQRVDFHNVGPDQIPGLIAMSITDGVCAGADLDPEVDAFMVLINAAPEPVDFPVEGAGAFALHPVQADGVDDVVQAARFVDGVFTVPGRTAAVFVETQGEAQGEGLPCNAR